MCRTIMKNNHFMSRESTKVDKSTKTVMIVNFLELCRAEWNNFLLQVYISFQLISQQSLCWRDCTATSLSLYNTYELNSKQKHKFLVTHLISTPHKLFHISRECILEVSTRLHKISQCPEGNFTRLGPFPC